MTRAEKNICWIQEFCVATGGLDPGKFVRLSQMEQETVRKIYDHPKGVQPLPVEGPLAAFLALLHTCGPEAVRDKQLRPQCTTDTFTVWAATSPALREVLKRDGEAVTCPELGTQWPTAA